MNIKQYFAHLGYWVRTFPRWSDNEHTTTGIAGSGEYYCLLCDFVEIEKPNKACTRRAKVVAQKVSSKSKKVAKPARG